ncbi:MAG: cupin domain-containing protein [Caulobacteraceae bacterium]|nr:cupin domain-containing protein [Caulobacteraceae bacterium]
MKTRKIDKPWGHEEVWAETSHYVGKKLFISPRCRLSRQYHVQKEETFSVLSGEMLLEVGDPSLGTHRIIMMGAGDVFHCDPGTIHRMCAGAEGCVVLEVSTPHLDDVVRLEDDYSRRSSFE